jgi:hypothetical protein
MGEWKLYKYEIKTKDEAPLYQPQDNKPASEGLDTQKEVEEMWEFVLLALRTRVNTRTGFTPYELVFGVKCSKFDNWKVEQPESEIAEISQRANQLKDIVEITRPKAKKNSDIQQEKSKGIEPNGT